MRRKTRKQLGGNKEGRRTGERGGGRRTRTAEAEEEEEEEEGPRVARGRRKEASLPPPLLPSILGPHTYDMSECMGRRRLLKEGKVRKAVPHVDMSSQISGNLRMRTSSVHDSLPVRHHRLRAHRRSSVVIARPC